MTCACTCPTCGHVHRREPQEPEPDPHSEIRAECNEKGITILPGDRVNGLRDVATLCGVRPGTFRNWRMWKDMPLGETEVDGSVTYSLGDIELTRRMTGR